MITVVAGVIAGVVSGTAAPVDDLRGEAASGLKEGTYLIAGRAVRLHDGVSTMETAPGAASRIVTRYFGNELRTDLNADGKEDVAFLLTQETDGSGIFFYLAAALSTGNGYIGSEAVFLGDRIAPRTTGRQDELVVVNFATRAPGEPFLAPPGIERRLYLKFDTETRRFAEVVPDFEGEADPQRMSLGMKTWTWVRTLYSNDVEITPHSKEAFTLTFEGDRFSATTDCNSMSGRYSADGHHISFAEISATRMFCAESQEEEFSSMLLKAASYHFTSRGELILDLKFDTGITVLR
jgi:heat shock protein HslJ